MIDNLNLKRYSKRKLLRIPAILEPVVQVNEECL